MPDISGDIFEMLGDHLIELVLHYGKGQAGSCTGASLLGTDPLIDRLALRDRVGVACPPIGDAVGTAPYLSGEHALVLEGAGAALYGAAAFPEDLIGSVPELLADYCGDCLAALVLIGYPFRFGQEALFAGAVVNDLDFVAAVPAFILGVLNYAVYRVVVDAGTVSSAVAFVIQDAFYLAGALLSRGVELEYLSDHYRFFLIDDEAAVLFIISEYAAVAEDVPALYRAAVSPADTLTELADFILRDRGHYPETELGVGVEGAKIIDLKEYADSCTQKLPRIGEAVYNVPCKAADLFGEHKIEYSGLAVTYHPHEVFAVLGRLAAHTVNIAFDVSPVGVAVDELGEIGDLIFYGVLLLFLFGGYTGVVGHSYFEIKYGEAFCTHTVGALIDIHIYLRYNRVYAGFPGRSFQV